MPFSSEDRIHILFAHFGFTLDEAATLDAQYEVWLASPAGLDCISRRAAAVTAAAMPTRAVKRRGPKSDRAAQVVLIAQQIAEILRTETEKGVWSLRMMEERIPTKQDHYKVTDAVRLLLSEGLVSEVWGSTGQVNRWPRYKLVSK